jgi:hypothetical protein
VSARRHASRLPVAISAITEVPDSRFYTGIPCCKYWDGAVTVNAEMFLRGSNKSAGWLGPCGCVGAKIVPRRGGDAADWLLGRMRVYTIYRTDPAVSHGPAGGAAIERAGGEIRIVRMTIFMPSVKARTIDFNANDVGSFHGLSVTIHLSIQAGVRRSVE